MDLFSFLNWSLLIIYFESYQNPEYCTLGNQLDCSSVVPVYSCIVYNWNVWIMKTLFDLLHTTILNDNYAPYIILYSPPILKLIISFHAISSSCDAIKQYEYNWEYRREYILSQILAFSDIWSSSKSRMRATGYPPRYLAISADPVDCHISGQMTPMTLNL